MDERAEEEVVLRLVLDHVYKERDWPQLKDLHRRIYRDLKADFDVREVAARLAPSSSTSYWGLEEQLLLPVSAFRGIREGDPLLEALAAFIAYAVGKYRSSAGDVEVTQREVEGALDFGQQELELLPLVLERESFVIRGHRDGDDGWIIEISDEIMRLRDVTDVDSYLACKDQLHAADTRDRAAMARAHQEMILATSRPPPESLTDIDRDEKLSQIAPRGTFVARHRRSLASFGLAVLASLVAALLWALITGYFEGDSVPTVRTSSSPLVEARQHPLRLYALTLQDVQRVDERGSGWTDVTDEQVSSFGKDELCGRAARPSPELETAVAYQRGTSQFVLQAIGRFAGDDAEAYFDDLRRVTASCSSWRAEEFGAEVTKTIENVSEPHVAEESLRMLLTTIAGPSFPAYRIDNVYVRQGNVVVNVAQLVSIAPPDEDFTTRLVRVVAAKM